MAQVAFAVAEQLHDDASSTYLLPAIHISDLVGGGTHRVVTNTHLLPRGGDLPCVGFISKKQVLIADEVQQNVTNADKNMLVELAQQPALLSYSSLQLADGNWCNLVIFAQDSAKKGITTTALHQYAAFTLAPQYYQWIRLHHGTLSSAGATIELHVHTTKQYCFHKLPEPPLLTGPVLATPEVAAL
jgi:putative sterol carrier protein